MKDEKRKVTIYDIAKLSGTAPGTVSRALNNIGYIKQETREKIEAAAKQLNYTPTRAAQSLKTKHTGLLLVAIPDMNNPFYVQMIAAIQEEVRKNGYSMILFYTDGTVQYEQKAFEMLQEHVADGMIMVNLNHVESYIPFLKKNHLPLVLCQMSNHMKNEYQQFGFDDICIDTKQAMKNVVEYFYLQGHRRIGYIGGNQILPAFLDRFHGYQESLYLHHIPFLERDVVLSKNWMESDGYQAAKQLYERGNMPTAICCSHDLMALGVMQFLKEKKIQVGTEISIAGMDNLDIGEKISPTLTSVCIHQNQMGHLAAKKVISRIFQKNPQEATKTVLTGEMIIRESSLRKLTEV